MAITTSAGYTNLYGHQGGTLNQNTIEYTDYAIKGELVYSNWEESVYKFAGLNSAALVDHEIEIKRILMRRLVEEMMRKKCIEFTKQEDVASNMMMFRARAFVVPNADVQLLRVKGIIE